MKKFFSLIVLFFVISTYGAVTVNVNGSNYSIPQTNERGWGTAVTSWIQAISSNTLQPVGGSFTLTNDVDFGANFGLKAPYYLSRNLNPATSGLFRLSLTDYIGWRNNANNGNLILGVNASDKLTFNGTAILSSGSIVNADINSSAAIDSSKIANGLVSNTEFQSLDGVSAPIVTTTGTQSLTNKDIDGGTASNSNRITIPKAAKTTLDALTRKQGTIVYDTTSNKPYYDDGANLKVIGSGSGGATNLIEDGDAESGFSNFVEGSYSAATRPAGTFTASSGTGLFAISTSTSSPLFGNTSFLLTKSSGASRQGRAIERTITIDAGYRTKMLKTRIDYTIVSGSFVAGSNGTSPTDSSLIWYVGQYNGSTWSYTEPSTFKMFSSSTTNSDWVEGEFQVNSDTTQLKLIAYVAETANSAWVVKAEVGFRLSTFLAGTTVTDWQSYTPTVSNLGTGSAAANFGKWRRVGDSIQLQIHFNKDASAGSGASTVTWSLPAGLVIDNAKLSSGNAASRADSIGSSWIYSGGNYSPSVFPPLTISTTTLGIGKTSAAVPLTGGDIGSGVYILFDVQLPIAGWQSSTAQSDGFDSRNIVFDARTYSGVIATSAATWTTLTFTTVTDTTGSWNGTDTWTCPTSGWYRIKTFGSQNANASAYFDVGYRISAGSDVLTGRGIGTGTASAVVTGTDTVYLIAGQTIQGRAATEGTQGVNLRRLTIERVQSPTTISATARVSFYAHTSTTAASTSSPFIYTTVTDNTFGAYSTSTGKFRAPFAGYATFRVTSYTGATLAEPVCYLNSVAISRNPAQASAATPAVGTCSTPMNEGDTMEIRPSGSATASGDHTLNNFSGFLVK